MRPSDDEVDYLLSGGRLGGTQRDRIFAAAAQDTGRPHARRFGARARFATAGVATLAAAAACFLIWTRAPADGDGFRSKGATTTPSPSIEVACLRATLGACPRGSILAFSLGYPARAAAAAGLFVTAYLQPSTAGGPVWLLASEPASAAVPGAGGLLANGARLPDQQEAGTYAIHVLVTRRPLSRDQATHPPAGDLVARARFETTVPP